MRTRDGAWSPSTSACTYHDVLPAGLVASLCTFFRVSNVHQNEPAIEVVLYLGRGHLLDSRNADATRAAGGADDGAGTHGAGHNGGGERQGRGGDSGHAGQSWRKWMCAGKWREGRLAIVDIDK